MARILIVEDNPDQMRMLRDSLAREHRIETARLAEDGIALARTFRPDLVILDLRLPAMDGIEAGLWLKREHGGAGVRILVHTALAEPADQEAVLGSGCCDAFLPKPAPPSVVRAHVASLLAARPRPA
jgi:DNA-binding response OmpR family regulator